MELKVGMTYTAEDVVCEDNSAKKWGSGQLEVFATPAMVALMEKAALNAVAPGLPEGSDTVGTEVNVSHSKASGYGEIVRATATLKEMDGRKLVFDVEAHDSTGEIGRGTHTRFVIDTERFMAKLKK